MNSLILQTATRFMLPLLLMFSVFLLLRGHNEPGGGFTGGMVAAAAFVLYAYAFGVAQTRRAMPVNSRNLIGIGLCVALASGVPGMLRGAPFMTGTWIRISGPGQEVLDLGTPLLFDVGVYLVVVGITLMIILSLAEEG
jgi:multicomponent Na+:H+ antiporter subunit B